MKTILTFLLFALLSINLLAAETLTFKFSNPRIELWSPDNYLVFDILVKASANGTYLYSSQVICNIALGNFNTSIPPFVVEGFIDGNYDPPGPPTPQDKYSVVTNYNSGNLNIAVIANPNFNTTVASAHSEVTTNWQTLYTVYCAINNTSGVAGINFQTAAINGYQKYATGIAPFYAEYYNNPSLYEGYDFTNLYLGRIYSGGSNWTQAGGTLNWATPVNTSVWDTLTAAAVAGASASVDNLRIHSGGRLIVNPTGTLTVTGNIDNNAGNTGLVLKSDATGTASLLTSTANVPATVERYLTTSVWHLISSPVSGQSINNLVLASPFAVNGIKYGLAPYDNSIPNWVPYTTTSLTGAGNFISAKGYEAMLTANSPLNFKGTLTSTNTTAAVQVGANDWNLIGNPYSAAIFANAPADAANNFITANLAMFPGDLPHGHSHTAIYLWDPVTSAYKAVNNASPATYIQIGQSFFVKTAATGTASFTAAMRTHSSAPFYKNTQSIWPLVELKAKIGDLNKSTQIYYIPDMTTGVDNGYDAGIFTGVSTDNEVYTKIAGSDVDFAIQSLPDNDYENQVVPIGLNAPQGSTITFSADVMNLPGNMKVFLEDKLNGVFIRLDEAGSAYTVVLTSASSGAGRFFLHTSPLFLGTENQVADLYTIIPIPAEHKIRIMGKIAPNSIAAIYNISGLKLGNYALTAGRENEIPFENNTDGIYIVKIQNGTTLITKKFNWVY